jgi:hypothetical protein
MTLKELSQLYWLNREIELDKEQLEALIAKAEGPGALLSRMPRAGIPSDRLSLYAAEIADLRGILEEKIARCLHECNRLMRYIDGVPDARLRMILTLRFVKGLSWGQTAAGVGGGNTVGGIKKTVYRFLCKN